MCHDFCPHDLLPFVSSFMVLWLSWLNSFSLSLWPCASRNISNHMLSGSTSAAPTSSASVELFVFRFCFCDLLISAPRPKDIAPPVWLFMSPWTAYDASTQVFILVMSSAPRISTSSSVPRKYCSTRFNLAQSITLLTDTQVHTRKVMGSKISGRARWATCSSLQTTLRKVSLLWASSLSTLSCVSKSLLVHNVFAKIVGCLYEIVLHLDLQILVSTKVEVHPKEHVFSSSSDS